MTTSQFRQAGLVLADHAGRSAYPDSLRPLIDQASVAAACGEIRAWPGYQPTPLLPLAGLARSLGLAALHYKDEGQRLPLKSFKMLGGGYAVAQALAAHVEAKTGRRPSAGELAGGRFSDLTAGLTVTCATDGNHGRAVAWGARSFHCRAVIFIHAAVSEGRAAAIAGFGAEVRRVPGVYDDAVRAAAETEALGWLVISDTAYPGCSDMPRLVMHGYSMLAEEIADALPAPPTHMLLQCGVGGMAAAVMAALWLRWGKARPRFIVVEPERADCAYQSALAGRPTPAKGDLATLCAGLACGELSTHAWDIFRLAGDAFMTITDEDAVAAMRLLAAPVAGDPAVVAGECAGVGIAALARLRRDEPACAALGIDGTARVVVLGTEGDTDPAIYRRLTGAA